jgi:hypothetical protein
MQIIYWDMNPIKIIFSTHQNKNKMHSLNKKIFNSLTWQKFRKFVAEIKINCLRWARYTEFELVSDYLEFLFNSPILQPDLKCCIPSWILFYTNHLGNSTVGLPLSSAISLQCTISLWYFTVNKHVANDLRMSMTNENTRC